MQGMRNRLAAHSQKVVNVFGAVGYTLLIFVITLSMISFFSWMLNLGYIASDTSNANRPEPSNTDSTTGDQATLIALIFAYTIMILTGLVTVFVTVTLPYWLGKLGSRILKKIIRLCQIPVTPNSLLFAKILATGFAASPILLLIATDISSISLVFATAVIASITLVIFIVQHTIAKMSSFEAKDIW